MERFFFFFLLHMLGSFVGYSSLSWHPWSLRSWMDLPQVLLSFKVSIVKSAVMLNNFVYVIWVFSIFVLYIYCFVFPFVSFCMTRSYYFTLAELKHFVDHHGLKLTEICMFSNFSAYFSVLTPIFHGELPFDLAYLLFCLLVIYVWFYSSLARVYFLL